MKGVFKISVDGVVVYDKNVTGHMPVPGEAARGVEERLGPRLNWRQSH